MRAPERRRPAGNATERGAAALAIVALLVVIAFSATALLVTQARTASREAAERLDAARARWAAHSGVQAALDALDRTGDASIDGRADSLASIRPASGPPLDLLGAPDGTFTVRSERLAGGGAGPVFVVTARGKWGDSVRSFRAIAGPETLPALPAGFFGDEGVGIPAHGRIDACDTRAADPAAAVPGLAVLGSNGSISLGSAKAAGGGGAGGAGVSGPGAGDGATPTGPVVALPAAVAFSGVIYAPRADVHLSGGGKGGGGATARGLEVLGDVAPGPGAGVWIGPSVTVAGAATPRAARAPLGPAPVDPPAGWTSRGPVTVLAGDELALAADVTVFDELTVNGTVRIGCPVDVYVRGRLAVAGAGRIVVEGAGALRLYVGGSVSLGDGGLGNAGPPARAVLICAADSALDPGAKVDISIDGALVGAIACRSLKVTGQPHHLRYDRACADAVAPVVYRIQALVEVTAEAGR